MPLPKYRLLALNAVLLLALTGSVWGRKTENLTVAQTDFLRPASFRDWKSTEQFLTRRETELLKPDAVLLKTYVSPGKEATVELAVIAGHRKQTVHTPGFCMVGGGWEVLSTKDYVLSADNRQIPAIRSLMGADGQQMLVTYFFTDGDFSTRELVRYQAAQMVKRIRAESPTGALVRIIVPITADRKAAEQLSDEFAREMVPQIFKNLRESRGKGSAHHTVNLHFSPRGTPT